MSPKFYNQASFILAAVTALLCVAQTAFADPSKYPQFAQQQLPENVTPAFIYIDELVAEVKAGKKPLIVDVRSSEEFKESHIVGSVSAPIMEFAGYLGSIPKDRLVILY